MKKKLSVILVVLMLLTCTGCGSSNYIKDKEKQLIQNNETGQSVRNDILCRPKDKKLLSIYEKYEKQMQTKLSKLPECEDFKLNSTKYHGLWESIFVKPLAWVIIKVGALVRNFGIAVMLVGALIRIVLLPLSKKSLTTSENMKKAQPEMNRIEKKYQNKTDNESMMAKSQEMMMVYKKYNINPVSGCLVSFIQLPLFFAFLEAINRVPAIFEESLFGINLGTNSLIGITNGSWTARIIYIAIILLILLTTYLSFKINMSSAGAGGEAEKQMQMMSKFMIVMISVVSITLPVAIALYWIVTNGIMVLQNLLMKAPKRKKKEKIEVIRDKKNKK